MNTNMTAAMSYLDKNPRDGTRIRTERRRGETMKFLSSWDWNKASHVEELHAEMASGTGRDCDTLVTMIRKIFGEI